MPYKFQFFCICFGVSGLDFHNGPFFEPFKIQDIILFILSQLFQKQKPCILSNVEYNYEMIWLLHKYLFMHFFVGRLWLSLLKIYMCQVWRWRHVYEFKNNWVRSRSHVFAKFIAYIYTHSNTQRIFNPNFISTTTLVCTFVNSHMIQTI